MSSLGSNELCHVLNTYGYTGYWGIIKLAKADAYQAAPAEAVLDAFKNQPTVTTTSFFRDPSLRAVAEKVAPHIAPADRPLEVRHVGGGSGHEAYSFGALLAGNDISFRSNSVDVNPDIQPDQESPRLESSRHPADRFEWESDIKRYITPYFAIEKIRGPAKNGRSKTTYLVSPMEPLITRVGFTRHDLLDGPPPGNPDITFARNIMGHYPWDTRDNLLRSALGGMTKGIVALEVNDDYTAMGNYNRWVASLGRFGLTPCRYPRGSRYAAMRRRVFDYDAAANQEM